MTEINLRSYIQEIDNLIEEGQELEEAIAHCRHILKTYPKHIDTYRLLGKAYLESKRFGDASDIFQRVLSAIPNDFVSHVGMAIIREDEGNLDAAIWHMERGSESQPGNAAIEEELKRLIGKRDGIEPQRVRPTRGALARMYYHGELYSYAASELQTALEEDPDRPDLQLLLADTFWRTDQRLEAADLCGQILDKLPYCFLANQITAALLQASGKPEESAVNLRRLIALDPYMAFIESPMDSPSSIDAGAVRLEKLSWLPGQPLPSSEGTQPDWAASLGVDLRGDEAKVADREDMPSWLKTPSSPTQEGAPKEATPIHPFAGAKPPPGAEIPDWMREAGWVESSGEATEGPSELGGVKGVEEATLSQDRPLAPADLPGWLSEISSERTVQEEVAPISKPTTPESPSPIEMEDSQGLPDWIREITPSSEEETPEHFEPAFEERPGMGIPSPEIEPSQPEPPAEIETPGLEDVFAGDETFEEEIPDYPPWLEPSTPGATDTIVTWLGDKSIEEKPTAEDIPNWMRGTGPLEDPSRRRGLTPEQELPEEPLAEPSPTFEDITGIPEDVEEAIPVEDLPTSAIPIDEPVPEWLDEISEPKEGLPTQEPFESEEAPEWLTEEPLEAEGVPAMEEAAPPSWLEDLDEEFEEEIIEELGEPEETLEALEKPPDWLNEVIREDILSDAEQIEEKPEWLEGVVDTESILEEEAAANLEEAPEWLMEMSLVEEVDTSPTDEDQEEPPEWLKGLTDTEIPEPEEELAGEEAPPDWVTQESFPESEEEIVASQETPEWLRELTEPTSEPVDIAKVSVEATHEESVDQERVEQAEEITEIPSETGLVQDEIPEGEPEAGLTEEIPVEAEVPDWLMDMGEVTSEAEAAVEETIEEPAAHLPPEKSLEPSEAPDWLQDLREVPIEAETSIEEPAPETPVFSIDEEALPIEEALKISEEMEKTGISDEITAERETPETPVPSGEIAISAEEAPDWLQDMLGAPPEEITAGGPIQDISEAIPAEEFPSEAEAMDWLKEISEVPSQIEEIPEHADESLEPATPEPAIPMDEAPVWLEEFEEIEPEAIPIPDETLSEQLQPEEEEVWLEEFEETEAIPISDKALSEQLQPDEEAISFEETEPEAILASDEAFSEQLQPEEEEAWLDEFEEPEAIPISDEVLSEQLQPEEEAVSIEETPDWLQELSGPPVDHEIEVIEELEEIPEDLISFESADEIVPSEMIEETIEEAELIDEVIVLEGKEIEEESQWEPEFLQEEREIEATPESPEEVEVEDTIAAFEDSFDWLQESVMEVAPEPEQPTEPMDIREQREDLVTSIENPLDDDDVFDFLDSLAAREATYESEAMIEEEGQVEPSPITAPLEGKLMEEHALPEELDESLDWLEQLADEEPVEDFSPPIFVEGLEEEEEAEIPQWLEEVAEKPDQVQVDQTAIDEVEAVERKPEEPPSSISELSSMETMVSKRPPKDEAIHKELEEEFPEGKLTEPLPGEPTLHEEEQLWIREVEEKPSPPEEAVPPVSEPELPSDETYGFEPETIPAEILPEAAESKEGIAQPVEEPVLDPTAAKLNDARRELENGQIENALSHYSKLIEEKAEMAAVIQDLRSAIEKTPREPMLWQILGDALMKVGQLSDAIDAYRRGMEAV
jgi:tetratricopeptide (TPR) repeat protein